MVRRRTGLLRARAACDDFHACGFIDPLGGIDKGEGADGLAMVPSKDADELRRARNGADIAHRGRIPQMLLIKRVVLRAVGIDYPEGVDGPEPSLIVFPPQIADATVSKDMRVRVQVFLIGQAADRLASRRQFENVGVEDVVLPSVARGRVSRAVRGKNNAITQRLLSVCRRAGRFLFGEETARVIKTALLGGQFG